MAFPGMKSSTFNLKSDPAWKTKPSYYLVATEDKMIPPPAQRAMAGRAKAQVASN